MPLISAQLPLIDLGPPPITDQMRRDLAKLEAARPIGLTRVGNHWKGLGGRIDRFDASALTANGLASVDYAGRHPRLKITQKGRRVVAKENAP